ncbi:prp1 [Malassezia furfur]|nr:prp1 [Malassezia furfur]
MASSKPNKLAFLSQPAPAGYVAGLGRGASGFTTRSDIGPAREGPSAEAVAAARAKRGEEDDEEDDERFQDPEEEAGLFASAVYERDDEEADRIWESVDRQMDERRRKQREARERAEREEARLRTPKIQAQFADLKRNLTTVSAEEWAALPEPGNLTGKRRKAALARESRDNRTYALPDSVLVGARDRNQVQNEAADVDMDGTRSTVGGATSSLTEIGEARNKLFSHQLDQASSSSGAAQSGLSSSIDPQGYLTELSGVSVKSDVEIGDIKKARSLLDSVIKTNPKHAPGWIAAARLEEVAGKMAVARKVIAQGCEQCPKSEDVWLESARLNTPDNAKVILARAIQHLSQSVAIWLCAEQLENDPESKKRVLRKALEHVPHSVKLWKRLVNLEESPEDARILLAGAVEAIPLSVELWLTLARLSPPAEAKSVLNKARRTIPTSHEIWIAAARLLEESGEPAERIDKTVAAAVASLEKAGAVLSREQWLREAEQVEREGSPATCAAIVKATVYLDIDPEDRSRVWAEDAHAALEQGYPATARAIYACALHEFPDDTALWRAAAALEQQHGTREALEALLERAVQHCPRAEPLWLQYAAEKQRAGDVPGARDVLSRAFDHNLGSEAISLAAAALEAQHGDARAASLLLARARREVDTPRVWLKSVQWERTDGTPEAALALVQEALQKFPRAPKLHMVHGQLHEARSDDAGLRAARDAYAAGRPQCPDALPLWLLSSRLEERAGHAPVRVRCSKRRARRTSGATCSGPSRPPSSCARQLRAGQEPAGAWAAGVPGVWRAVDHVDLARAAPGAQDARGRRAAAHRRPRAGDLHRGAPLLGRGQGRAGAQLVRQGRRRRPRRRRRVGLVVRVRDAHARTEGDAPRAQVLEQAVRAAPRHGAAWAPLRKDPRHVREDVRTLLPVLAAQLVAAHAAHAGAAGP